MAGMDDGGAVDFDTVFSEEKTLVGRQRENRGQPGIDSEDHLKAISISGGGIRSASFALGALQALDSGEDVLPRIDYLSTVSGGGYIGSSWTWFNYLKRTGRIECDPNGYFFPFGVEDQGVRSTGSGIQNKILSYLRQHSSYLIPGFCLNYISALAVVLRNMVMSLLVYISLLVVVFAGLWKLEALLAAPGNPFRGVLHIPEALSLPHYYNISLVLGYCAAVALLALGIIYGPITFFLSKTSNIAYRLRTFFQCLMGSFAGAALVFILIGLLPVLIIRIEHAVATSTGGLLGVLGGLWHFIRQQHQQISGFGQQVVVVASSLLIIMAILALAYFISYRYPSVWPIALVVGLFFGFVINLNQFGLGRMYRDRLIETFMPNPEAIHQGRWQLATDAGTSQFSDICTGEDQGPYHLVNTNLILIDSEKKKFRSRGGDNFILSSLFCGSDATQWTATQTFNRGDLTLATAMATSGAAVNPHTGANSKGITKNPLVSFLMFILGLRLGLYVTNPRRVGRMRMPTPNFLGPGIYQGLLGMGFDKDSNYLALSDGGHFENMAAYELIRRRVDVIVASEAGQDPEFSFADLANLVEKVRVDFGVHIRFIGDYDLRFLIPGSAETDPPFAERYEMAKRGYAIARIEYPDTQIHGKTVPAKHGHLFFLKATLTKNLPADVYGYKDQYPMFPNQTTADQFFDEVQLEAYRELGYHLARDMLENDTFRSEFNLG